MDYNSIAATLQSNISNIETSISTLQGTNLTSSWQGETAVQLNTDLEETVALLEQEKSNLSHFIEILNNVETYKTTKSQIESLQAHLSGLPDIPENANARNRISGEISSLETENATLASTITASLGGFSAISSTKTVVNYTI